MMATRKRHNYVAEGQRNDDLKGKVGCKLSGESPIQMMSFRRKKKKNIPMGSYFRIDMWISVEMKRW